MLPAHKGTSSINSKSHLFHPRNIKNCTIRWTTWNHMSIVSTWISQSLNLQDFHRILWGVFDGDKSLMGIEMRKNKNDISSFPFFWIHPVVSTCISEYLKLYSIQYRSCSCCRSWNHQCSFRNVKLPSHTLRTQDPCLYPPHPLCQYSNGPASFHDVPSQLACHVRERRDASNVSAFEGNREKKPVDFSWKQREKITAGCCREGKNTWENKGKKSKEKKKKEIKASKKKKTHTEKNEKKEQTGNEWNAGNLMKWEKNDSDRYWLQWIWGEVTLTLGITRRPLLSQRNAEFFCWNQCIRITIITIFDMWHTWSNSWLGPSSPTKLPCDLGRFWAQFRMNIPQSR